MTKRKPLTDDQLADSQRLKNLWDKRFDGEMTQEEAAHKCGWSTQGAFNQYLHGKIPIGPRALMKISRALGVHPSEISPVIGEEFHLDLSKVGPGSEEIQRELKEQTERELADGTLDALVQEEAGSYCPVPTDIDNLIRGRSIELIKELEAAGIEPAHALGLSGAQLESIEFSDKPLEDEVQNRLLMKMNISRQDVERQPRIMRYASFSVAELTLKELLDILSGKVRNADKSLRTTALGMIQTYLESDSPRPELIDALETIIERPKADKQFIESDTEGGSWFF